jgi:hypothetical protein
MLHELSVNTPYIPIGRDEYSFVADELRQSDRAFSCENEQQVDAGAGNCSQIVTPGQPTPALVLDLRVRLDAAYRCKGVLRHTDPDPLVAQPDMQSVHTPNREKPAVGTGFFTERRSVLR